MGVIRLLTRAARATERDRIAAAVRQDAEQFRDAADEDQNGYAAGLYDGLRRAAVLARMDQAQLAALAEATVPGRQCTVHGPACPPDTSPGPLTWHGLEGARV